MPIARYLLASIGLCLAAMPGARAQTAAPANDGLHLPPGFHATVFADHLSHPRHLSVAPNGVVYVNTWSGRYFGNDKVPDGGFLIALRAADPKGPATEITRFGPSEADGNHGGTGVWVYGGYVYAETNDKIVRYKLPDTGIVPTGAAETVVSGLPLTGDHPMHPIAIDHDGNLFVDLGSATNACQTQNRAGGAPGADPCTELETRGGIWRFDANKLDQAFSPAQRFATGLRNSEAQSFDSQGRMFAVQHGRDQLFQNWPNLYSPLQSAENPAEVLVAVRQGGDYGWPECYYDGAQKKLVLAPEYGGDGGHKIGVCAQKLPPVAAFPAHWAPNDMLIYTGNQFPAAFKDGAFIAFHGSWNRAPAPQGGYNIVFQPLKNGVAAGPWILFADGFAGEFMEPGRAVHRPTGLAVAPDGSLYVADDKGGRIWRITYSGDKGAKLVSASRAHVSAMVLPDIRGLPMPPGIARDQLVLGDKIFHGQAAGGTCAGCHGADGKGSTVGSDLTSGRRLWNDGTLASIANVIRAGVAKPKAHTGLMPPKGGAELSDAELNAVASYVWAIGYHGGK